MAFRNELGDFEDELEEDVFGRGQGVKDSGKGYVDKRGNHYANKSEYDKGETSPVNKDGSYDTHTLAGAGLTKDAEQKDGLPDNREGSYVANLEKRQEKRMSNAVNESEHTMGAYYKDNPVYQANKTNAKEDKHASKELNKLHGEDVKDHTTNSATDQILNQLNEIAKDPNFVSNTLKQDSTLQSHGQFYLNGNGRTTSSTLNKAGHDTKAVAVQNDKTASNQNTKQSGEELNL